MAQPPSTGAGRLFTTALGLVSTAAVAAEAVDSRNKIDMHHHIYPPMLQEAILAAGGEPALPPGKTWPWNFADDDAFMSRIGVGAVIYSITTPGPLIKRDPTAQASLARACNEWVAREAVSRDPSRYGFFATLPSLQAPELAVTEAAYALDDLKADGVILLTQYGNGTHSAYLGNPRFEPMWRELDKRGAVVLVHPTMREADRGLGVAAWAGPRSPPAMYDYPQETARAAFDLVRAGVTARYPGIKFVLSHAGGNFPWLADRLAMAEFTPYRMGEEAGTPAEIRDRALASFYYDTALNGMNDLALQALLGIAGEKEGREGRIMFGTDYPNAPAKFIGEATKHLNGGVEMSDEARKSIYVGAAKKLFPRLLRGDGESKEEL